MKKIVLLYLAVGVMSFAKGITLDILLEELENTSYQKELYQIKKENNNLKESVYKKQNYNGVNVSGTIAYDELYERYESQGAVKFGDFYVEGEKYKGTENNFTYGFEKNIKDLIFSKEDNNLSELEITREIDKIELVQNLVAQKIEVIKLYERYIDSKLELDIKKTALNTLVQQRKILEKSYELGDIPKIDLNSLLSTYSNLKYEIKEIEFRLKNYKKQFKELYKLDVTDKILEKIDINRIKYEDFLENISWDEYEKFLLEKKKIEESIKYANYSDKMADLYLGAERDTKYDENRVFLRVSKDIFDDNIILEDEKSLLEEKKVEEKQLLRAITSMKIDYKNQIFSLEKNYEVKRNERILEEQKYKIKQIENKNGKASYYEVMELFEDVINLKVQEEQLKNSLSALVYEIKVEGEK